jgi:HK97 family phage major capsid protein
VAITRLSTDYAEDAIIDVADDLASEMAYAFAVKEDACLIDGDGSNTYGGIRGIRPMIIDGTHTAGAVAMTTATHDVFSEIDADDLVAVMAKLPIYAQGGAVWLCSSAANSAVFDALKAAAGGNNMMDLAGRPTSAYLGYPIVMSQSMPASLSTDYSNLVMLFLGNFSQAVTMGDRRGFTIRVDQSRYLEYDQIAVLGTERFDIVVHDLGDTTNAGPVVALVGGTS